MYSAFILHAYYYRTNKRKTSIKIFNLFSHFWRHLPLHHRVVVVAAAVGGAFSMETHFFKLWLFLQNFFFFCALLGLLLESDYFTTLADDFFLVPMQDLRRFRHCDDVPNHLAAQVSGTSVQAVANLRTPSAGFRTHTEECVSFTAHKCTTPTLGCDARGRETPYFSLKFVSRRPRVCGPQYFRSSL